MDTRLYGADAREPVPPGRYDQSLSLPGRFECRWIVIVTCRGVRNSVLSDLDQVGGIDLRRFFGDYDAQGNQVLTDGQLTFESIYRFKGQESPAVILVDIDPRADRRDREDRLLYCGMTRATIRLDLVACSCNPETRRFLEV